MKHLIEYKLWAGQHPYFVHDPLGGVFNGRKHYGISRDTGESYLPETVRKLTTDELSAIVQQAELHNYDNDRNVTAMTGEEKQQYLNDWLAAHEYSVA